MRKLLLAILGLFPVYIKTKAGEKIYLNITKADILKESYYRYANRKYCFCGGRLIQENSTTFIVTPMKVLKCDECQKEYY